MASMFARWLMPLAIMVQVAFASPPAPAQRLAPTDAQAIHDVVVDQLDALATDDAQRLFETITPEVREAFASSGDFLAMLRTLYPMVYRPRSVGFLPPAASPPGAIQVLEVTDQGGGRWLVLFVLEQQPDTTWRVSGCQVQANPWLTS